MCACCAVPSMLCQMLYNHLSSLLACLKPWDPTRSFLDRTEPSRVPEISWCLSEFQMLGPPPVYLCDQPLVGPKEQHNLRQLWLNHQLFSTNAQWGEQFAQSELNQVKETQALRRHYPVKWQTSKTVTFGGGGIPSREHQFCSAQCNGYSQLP